MENRSDGVRHSSLHLTRIFGVGGRSSSVRGAMSIVLAHPNPAKLRRSGMDSDDIVSPRTTDNAVGCANMPLLRSLAITSARVAIDMALLTELFARFAAILC